MKVCSVEGCERSAHCRGWCDLHYRRWLHHGDSSFLGGNGRSCGICTRDDAETVNLAILSMEEKRVAMADRLGVRPGMLNWHARECLGLVLAKGKAPRPGSLHAVRTAAARLDAVRRYVEA